MMEEASEQAADDPVPGVPAERVSPTELRTQVAEISESPIVTALLEAVDAVLLVLNSNRQILSANRRHRLSASLIAVDSALGMRPGEALACVEASKHPDGCGAAPACRSCGALRAIIDSQQRGNATEGECLLTVQDHGVERAHEFAVRATPVHLGAHDLTVLSLRDISGEKRREALEHVFFHDLLNTLAGLTGWSLRLGRSTDSDWRRPAERIAVLVKQLESEIHDQRMLLMAESGELTLEPTRVALGSVLLSLKAMFASHALTVQRTLEVQEPEASLELTTEPSLLFRVLTNMVTNALEATAPGGTVRLWSQRLGGSARPTVGLFVHNEAVLAPLVANRIFQRSFSTKGEAGRGLGTYGMKLLGDRYLGGKVSFNSRPGQGTTFLIELPLA